MGERGRMGGTETAQGHGSGFRLRGYCSGFRLRGYGSGFRLRGCGSGFRLRDDCSWFRLRCCGSRFRIHSTAEVRDAQNAHVLYTLYICIMKLPCMFYNLHNCYIAFACVV